MSAIADKPTMRQHIHAMQFQFGESRGKSVLRRILHQWRWQYEYELIEGYRTTREIPTWAMSPTANIVGTWGSIRRRLTWRHLPIDLWHPVQRKDDT